MKIIEVAHQLANERDAPPLAEMSRRLVEHGLRWRWTPSAIQRCIDHPETEVVVARDPRSQQRLGFAMMRMGREQANLLLLAVVPSVRRRGVGRGLVRWLELEASVAGLARVELEVRSQNTPARKFYESLGYREETLIPGYYQRRESAVRMAADLTVQRA